MPYHVIILMISIINKEKHQQNTLSLSALIPPTSACRLANIGKFSYHDINIMR